MIKIKHRGSFKKIEKFLKRAKDDYFFRNLDKYGAMGVTALQNATPKRTGRTASLWRYEIEKQSGGSYAIKWYNDNVNKGVNIALIIQYGHGTGRGAYIQGIDYINPALAPIFEEISDSVWREVTSS